MKYKSGSETLVTQGQLKWSREQIQILQARLDSIVAFVNTHAICSPDVCVECNHLYKIKDIAVGKCDDAEGQEWMHVDDELDDLINRQAKTGF